jgi:hypothetical protein
VLFFSGWTRDAGAGYPRRVMRSATHWLLLAFLGLSANVLAPSEAAAQKPAKAAKASKKKADKTEKADKADKASDAEKKAAEEPDDPKTENLGAEEKAAESSVKAAGTEATEGDKKKKGEPEVVKVEESDKQEGVKTYTFSAIEVEGRLKSPQIIYFLRRVRAEFEAGALGHRSFVPELSDTRRSPALR